MAKLLSRSVLESLIWSGVALLGIGVVGFLQFPQLGEWERERQKIDVVKVEQELTSKKMQLELLEKIPSFGVGNLIADWIFLDFVGYFGDDDIRKVTGYAFSPEFFKPMVKHDPRFRDMYLFMSTSCSLFGGNPEISVSLTNEGLSHLSPTVPEKSFYIWRYKALDEYLLLGRVEDAVKSFEMSAQWASVYQDEEGQLAQEISRKTANFLAENPKSELAQVGGWMMVLQSATDDKTRHKAIEQMDRIGWVVTKTPQGGYKVIPKKSP